MFNSKNNKNNKNIAVIGGANIDIVGRSKNKMQLETSNPGQIRVGFGGVGCNIAHYLGLLNIPVTFFSAVGEDDEGKDLLDKLRHAGVDTHEIIQSKKDPTGKYVAIMDERGDMATAISDTEIMKRITPRYLIAKAGLIQESQMVIIDTNLTPQAIHYITNLCHREGIPLIVDPVSVVKSRKLLGVLTKIDYLTPNLSELSSLTGMDIVSTGQCNKAIQFLRQKGIKNIILTQGAQGVRIFSEEYPDGKLIHVRRRKAVNTTGAGDALLAGMAYGLYHQYNLLKSVLLGLTVSTLSVSSQDTVNAKISESILKNHIRQWLLRSL